CCSSTARSPANMRRTAALWWKSNRRRIIRTANCRWWARAWWNCPAAESNKAGVMAEDKGGVEGGWEGPLAGVKVLDLTRVLAGPFATQILGDLGADVIKVEPPDSGDDTRRFPPHRDGESHYFISINRSKRSLVVNLRQEGGKEVLRRLIARTDVLV